MTTRARFAGLLVAALLSAVPGPARAQNTPGPAPAAQPAAPTGTLTAQELDQLLGPIALYPDALLANVLAASVYPDEVKEAAGYVKGGGDKKLIDSRAWEAPVKAIAKVPDVARMMGEYMDWTVALGQAYLTQAQDVMAAVQRLRQKAQANGALKTTDQQKVVVEGGAVYIESPDPEVVYVPYYQPSVVYVDDPYDDWAAGVIGFGAGVVVGAIWADLDCDWHHGCIGWGHGDVDIDINRGDINIGEINAGNRVNHYSQNRVGKEGGAWTPNRAKPLATTRPSQYQNVRNQAARPQVSTAGRAPANMARPATRPSTTAARPSAPARPATPAARPSTPTANRVPSVPPAQRAQSAYRGGSDTRATSNRGASSRQAAQRSSGGRSAPARSGGSRGGGGRGGGRR